MFLRDKNNEDILVNTVSRSRIDINPLVVKFEGDGSNSSSTYTVKSSLGNTYTIEIRGGIFPTIKGDIENISHIKIRTFGDWVSANNKIKDIKVYALANQNVYGRPFYKTIENTVYNPAEEIRLVPSEGYQTAISCDDGESTVRAYLDYTIFPFIERKWRDTSIWNNYTGYINYRSTYTSIPFDIQCKMNNSNEIYGLYLDNCFNNPEKPGYWNMVLEICEKNPGRTTLNTSLFSHMRLLNNVYRQSSATYNTSNETITVNSGTSVDWYTPTIHNKNIGYDESTNARTYGIKIEPNKKYKFSCDYNFNKSCDFRIFAFNFTESGILCGIDNSGKTSAASGSVSWIATSEVDAAYLCTRITIYTAGVTGTVKNIKVEEIIDS